MVFIAVTTIPIISFLRSWVLKSDDFGWRAALVLLFPLLLLASELIVEWRTTDLITDSSADRSRLNATTPQAIRSMASLTLAIGVISTVSQALLLRLDLPMMEAEDRTAHRPYAGNLSHNAYISSIGFANLDASIPTSAVVQANPQSLNPFRVNIDIMEIKHQTAIVVDRPWCGSELGGDPSGCPTIAVAIDALFNGADADQARTTCREFGIQYLVARIYDPAWQDKQSWVWKLNPVVANEEFRALDCRQ